MNTSTSDEAAIKRRVIEFVSKRQPVLQGTIVREVAENHTVVAEQVRRLREQDFLVRDSLCRLTVNPFINESSVC